MPRQKANTATAEQPADAGLPAAVSMEAPASPQATVTPETAIAGDRGTATHAAKGSEIPDPQAMLTATLGTGKNAPKIELLRSRRFNQMQFRSEEPLQDKHQEMLKQAGWTDRTEKEGIYTKQLPKEPEKWRQAADAERLFAQIAGEMRAGKGLGPVSYRA